MAHGSRSLLRVRNSERGLVTARRNGSSSRSGTSRSWRDRGEAVRDVAARGSGRRHSAVRCQGRAAGQSGGPQGILGETAVRARRLPARRACILCWVDASPEKIARRCRSGHGATGQRGRRASRGFTASGRNPAARAFVSLPCAPPDVMMAFGRETRMPMTCSVCPWGLLDKAQRIGTTSYHGGLRWKVPEKHRRRACRPVRHGTRFPGVQRSRDRRQIPLRY